MTLKHGMNMQMVEKKWTYELFQIHDEVTVACLGVHFPLDAAYEDVDWSETVPSENKISQE